MIAELQAERQKRQAAEEELKAKGEQEPTDDGSDPKKALEKLLDERERKEAADSMKEAIDEFRDSVNEFSKDNDAAGIVFAEFERELGKFNLEGLKTKGQFVKRFKEVHEFMNRNKKPSESTPTPYPGSSKASGSEPKEGDSANLSDVEKNLIKDMGWEEERYLKVKASRPNYVASLLKFRS
jgi:hypothetical protein